MYLKKIEKKGEFNLQMQSNSNLLIINLISHLVWDNQVAFWACCSTYFQPRKQIHRLFHWSPFLWECIAWWVRSCSHWLHVPKNDTVYKNRKKFPISPLFPDVLQILFHCLPLSYVSSLLWAATLRWSSRLTGDILPRKLSNPDLRGKPVVDGDKCPLMVASYNCIYFQISKSFL